MFGSRDDALHARVQELEARVERLTNRLGTLLDDEDRHGRGLRRVLVARRPAVRHRAADHVRHRAGHPGPRDLGALAGVRLGVPGTEIIPRLYIVHVLLLPGILLALVGVHLALVWYQKHTQFPGVPRTERNEVGVRILPVFAVKSGAFFVGVVAVLGLLGGLLQINPVWLFGPYNAAHVSAGSQPDW